MREEESKLRALVRGRETRVETPPTLFHFAIGDKVLRRSRVFSKLDARATGPFEVVKVGGQLR